VWAFKCCPGADVGDDADFNFAKNRKAKTKKVGIRFVSGGAEDPRRHHGAGRRGESGTKRRDVLNPSVVSHGGRYYIFIPASTAKDLATGFSISADGRALGKGRGGVVVSGSASWGKVATIAGRNGHALWTEMELIYCIRRASARNWPLGPGSSDGNRWTKKKKLAKTRRFGELGTHGSWDERRTGADFLMLIRAADRMVPVLLGAGSRRGAPAIGCRAADRRGDVGRSWRGNPIYLTTGPIWSIRRNGSGEPACGLPMVGGGCLHGGPRTGRRTRRIGLDRSADGVHWKGGAGRKSSGGRSRG